jgi:hypothetical protein
MIRRGQRQSMVTQKPRETIYANQKVIFEGQTLGESGAGSTCRAKLLLIFGTEPERDSRFARMRVDLSRGGGAPRRAFDCRLNSVSSPRWPGSPVEIRICTRDSPSTGLRGTVDP